MSTSTGDPGAFSPVGERANRDGGRHFRTTTSQRSKTGSRSTNWMPGLDGLRAVAVFAVLAFHADLISGGFVGVSLFFTLSGFLITWRNHSGPHGSRRFKPAKFLMARLRRLSPALIFAIALGVWAIVVAGKPPQVLGMSTDVAWAASYLWNWRELLHNATYGDQFTLPTAFDHFWSLAIEEQFYLAFIPLVVLLRRMRRRSEVLTLGLLCLASAGLTLFGGFSPGHRYFGLETRAVELLAGVLLAVGWPTVRVLVASFAPSTRRAVFVVAMGGFLALCLAGSTTGRLVTAGWIAFVPVISATLIAVTAYGKSIMSWKPLRWFGGLSYGIYLYHWPLKIVITQTWSELPPAVTFVLMSIGSTILAFVSYKLIEAPIRFKKLRPPAALARMSVGVIAIVVGLVALPNVDQRDVIDLDVASTANGGPQPTPPRATVAPGKQQVSWAAIGDSAALTLVITKGANGEHEWRTYRFGNVEFVQGEGDARLGCGLVKVEKWSDTCAGRIENLARISASNPSDVALLVPSVWDLDVTDEELTSTYTDVVKTLAVRGTKVVLLPSGRWQDGACAFRKAAGSNEACDESTMNEKVERMNRLAIAAARDGGATILDIREWLDSHNAHGELRPDGVHWSSNGAVKTLEYIGPMLVKLANE